MGVAGRKGKGLKHIHFKPKGSITGYGVNTEEMTPGLEPVKGKKRAYLRINKYMISWNDLVKDNRLIVKLCSNTNISPNLPAQTVTPAVSRIIQAIADRDEFLKKEYDSLSKSEQDTIKAFANTCHIDLGIESKEDIENHYNVLMGEAMSGNQLAKAKLRTYIHGLVKTNTLSSYRAIRLLQKLDTI
jgi:hypothetical protein